MERLFWLRDEGVVYHGREGMVAGACVQQLVPHFICSQAGSDESCVLNLSLLFLFQYRTPVYGRVLPTSRWIILIS